MNSVFRKKTLYFAQNPDLNELLPFGEYVPPEQLAESFPHFSVGLDAWELERLLQRLADTELAGSGRRHVFKFKKLNLTLSGIIFQARLVFWSWRAVGAGTVIFWILN